MASPRPRRPIDPPSKAEAAPSVSGRRIGWPAGPTRRTLFRLAARSAIACTVVGSLTLVAGWHASGLVRRGEIDRMLRMGANAKRHAPAEAKVRGPLDRGRMNALATAAAR